MDSTETNERTEDASVQKVAARCYHVNISVNSSCVAQKFA